MHVFHRIETLLVGLLFDSLSLSALTMVPAGAVHVLLRI